MECVPDWVAVMRSGYIGLKFGDAYTALGPIFTFIEALLNTVPVFDPEIVPLLEQMPIRPRPIFYQTNVFASKDARRVWRAAFLDEIIKDGTNDEDDDLDVDGAMIVTGHMPFKTRFGLESVAVETQREFFPVDERMRLLDRDGRI